MSILMEYFSRHTKNSKINNNINRDLKVKMEQPKIVIGQIIHCISLFTLQEIQNGFIIINSDGKILALDNMDKYESARSRFPLKNPKIITLEKTQLLIPGLIDTHIHAPQYPNAGLGYDKPLLEWLDHYTYKLEKTYKNTDLCRTVFDAVVRKTLDHGTTTACYFGSLYRESTTVLVDSVLKFGQRALIGKINMTRLAPDDYTETAQDSIRNTELFVGEVKGRLSELVQPVITPRFALNVDLNLMKELGRIAHKHDLHIQTHISENKEEIAMVRQFYPEIESYASVYHQADLLTPKTILAHGIYLSDKEIDLLSDTKTSIAHCPESNTLLSSGLCDVKKLISKGINVGLGTDVAGGASPSIINAMRAALTVSKHISFTKPNYVPLNYTEVFYLATLGGAKALALDDKTGNFQVGKCFDGIIVDANITNGTSDYFPSVTQCSPLELLQKFVYLGDDRNVRRVFVNGKVVK